MVHGNRRKFPIDMSLRLRSDQVAMKSLLEKMDFEVSHLYEKGRPIALTGRFAERIAERHYASIAHCEGNDSDVAPWIKTILAAIASNFALADCLSSGAVTATAWLAVFGEDERKPPPIAPELIAAATQANVTLFIENYTCFDEEGIPEKLWLNGPEAQNDSGSDPV